MGYRCLTTRLSEEVRGTFDTTRSDLRARDPFSSSRTSTQTYPGPSPTVLSPRRGVYSETIARLSDYGSTGVQTLFLAFEFSKLDSRDLFVPGQILLPLRRPTTRPSHLSSPSASGPGGD